MHFELLSICKINWMSLNVEQRDSIECCWTVCCWRSFILRRMYFYQPVKGLTRSEHLNEFFLFRRHIVIGLLIDFCECPEVKIDLWAIFFNWNYVCAFEFWLWFYRTLNGKLCDFNLILLIGALWNKIQ